MYNAQRIESRKQSGNRTQKQKTKRGMEEGNL